MLVRATRYHPPPRRTRSKTIYLLHEPRLQDLIRQFLINQQRFDKDSGEHSQMLISQV